MGEALRSQYKFGEQRRRLSWLMLALFAFFLIPMGISQPQVSPSDTLPNVEKKGFPEVLNEAQRLYMQWTEEFFAGYLDRSEYAELSASTKAELEEKWIKTLAGPWSPKYYDAINCLAAIKSKKAVKPLLHIAAERREKDNRDRWMAVRALGIIGDESVVPELIHLIYHYNQNTRFWAQISLARLTGVNFGYDWQKWGEWWNLQGGQLPFSPEKITWTTSYPEWADPQKQKQGDKNFIERLKGTKKDESATISPTPKTEVNYLGQPNFPSAVALDPPNGATDVDPARKHITVTFDRPMQGGYSWVDKGKRPKLENIEWINDRQCRAWVTLEPNREYGVWLNFGPNTCKFKSREGVSAERVYWTFRTRNTDQTDEPAKEEKGLLLNKAEELYKNKKFSEAIEVYKEIHEKYPDWNRTAHALMMIGVCYDNMGQREKALEAFEKAAKEYPDLKGFSETIYFYLGVAYVQAGEKEKAFGAFIKSVQLCEGVQDRNAFPCKQAIKWLEKLGAEISATFTVTEAVTLQEEIDKAESGGVVIVPPGKHTGPLQITKPITLRGENARNCSIELLGNEPAITVRGTKDVVLENLTVRWAAASTDMRLEAPAAIYVRDSEAVIRGCRLEPIDRPKDTPYGLLAAGRTNATFTEGRSTGFAYALIFLDGASGTVSNSILTDAGHSVVTLHAHSRVKIIGNILGRCDYHAVRNTGGTMDMTNNLVIGNNRAGAYLGNKSAHGRIANNLFAKSRIEIWSHAYTDVVIENNVFFASNGPGVGFHDTCNLTIRRNSFVNNAQGLAKYSKEGRPPGIGARTSGNHYWNNKEDFVNFDKETTALYGDPKFTDPGTGDFSLQKGSPLLDQEGQPLAGLTDPEPIRTLWATWSKLSQ